MLMRLLLAGTMLAALGSAPALADVKTGYDAWERGDYETAVREWRPLAIAGDADAQFNMGQAYKLGRGVPTDLKLAEDWFRHAALQGHLAARDNYGLMLFQNGKRKDALPYIDEAAGRGDPRAQYLYGTALFNGDIVQKDWPRAYALMMRASAARIPAASASLAQMDKFIPLDQRTRGMALARALEAAGRTSTSAALRDLPVSTPVRVAAAPKPVAPRQTPAPPPSGNWRIQLAAFSDASKAAALWTGLRSRIGALRPYQSFGVKAGAITRLQAGPLASRAAANTLCASVKAAGQACLPVAP